MAEAVYGVAKKVCYCRGCGDDLVKGDVRVTARTESTMAGIPWVEVIYHPACFLQCYEDERAEDVGGWGELSGSQQEDVRAPAEKHVVLEATEAKRRALDRKREVRSGAARCQRSTPPTPLTRPPPPPPSARPRGGG